MHYSKDGETKQLEQKVSLKSWKDKTWIGILYNLISFNRDIYYNCITVICLLFQIKKKMGIYSMNSDI